MSFFRAVTSATQSLSNLVETELVFGTEVSDPDSVFASNQFTVPAGWSGGVGGLSAGILLTSTETSLFLRLQRQTGGAGAWETIAERGFASETRGTISCYPIAFVAGDKYRVAYYGTASTKGNDPRNFFSGWVFPAVTKLGMFRGERTSDLSMALGGFRTATFQTELVDSHSLLDAATGIVTVPAGFNGGFLHLTAGMLTDTDAVSLYIERSTNSGSTWVNLAGCTLPTGVMEGALDAGAVAAVTGEQYRFSAFRNFAGFLMKADPRSFFSGIFFK